MPPIPTPPPARPSVDENKEAIEFYGDAQYERGFNDVPGSFAECQRRLRCAMDAVTLLAGGGGEAVAWLNKDGRRVITAADKLSMSTAGFGVWKEASESYNRPLYAAPLRPQIDTAVPGSGWLPTATRVFIDMDGVIVDFDAHMKALGMSGDECKRHPGAYAAMPAIPGALAAVRSIIGAGYEVWIATKPPTGIPFAYGDKAAWVMEHLPELKRRIVVTHHKGMLGRPGDWLIDDRPHKAYCEEFAGKIIPFGRDDIGWPEALGYLGIGEKRGLAAGGEMVKPAHLPNCSYGDMPGQPCDCPKGSA